MLEFLKFTTISETEINIKAVDITLPAPSYFKGTTFVTQEFSGLCVISWRLK